MYAGSTVIITLLIIYLCYLSGGFWSKAWTMMTAVLRPIVLGIIFAYLLSPIVNKLESKYKNSPLKKAARPLAVLISIVLVAIVLIGLLSIIVITISNNVSYINIDSISSLIDYIEHDFADFVDTLKEKLASFGISVVTIRTIFTTLAQNVKAVGSGILFGLIFAIYFLLDNKSISRYWLRAYHLIAGKKNDEKIRQLGHDANRVFSGYIRGQFIDASIVGILTSVGLVFAGVPNAAVIGILTGFGNLIPYIGPVVGYITLAIVCVASAEWKKLIIGGVLLALILFIDGNVINPKLLSDNVKIHPLLVIAALIGGGAIGGFVGMIIAVPTAAFFKVQLDRFLDSREQQVRISEAEIIANEDNTVE